MGRHDQTEMEFIREASMIENVFRFVDGDMHGQAERQLQEDFAMFEREEEEYDDGENDHGIPEKPEMVYMNPWHNVPDEKYEAFTPDRCSNIVCLIHQIISNDPLTKIIKREHKDRVAHGFEKYGHTVQSNPLYADQWAQHHYEELLDAAVYTVRRISDLREAGVGADNPTRRWLSSHLLTLIYDSRIVRNQLKETQFFMMEQERREIQSKKAEGAGR